MSQKIKHILVLSPAFSALPTAFAQLGEVKNQVYAPEFLAPGANWQTAVQQQQWPLILVDFDAPEPGATAVVQHILAVHPQTAILVIASNPTVADAVTVMRLGAHGFAAQEDLPHLVQLMKELLATPPANRAPLTTSPPLANPHRTKIPARAETTHSKPARRESERHLTSVIENMADLVWVMELPSHQITYLNPAVKTIYGISERDFYNDPDLWMKQLHPDERPHATKLEKILLEQGFRDSEYRVMRSDGEVRWLRDRAWLVRNETGEPIRVEGIATDVTDQKLAKLALQASEEKYRSLIESSDASITMVDENGRYLYLNAIAARPFGVAPEALVGRYVTELFPPDQAASILADVQKVIQQKTGLVLEPEVTINGESCWFRTSIQPVIDAVTGSPFAALIYASEITANKLAEREIAVQNAILHQTRDLIALGSLTGELVFINEGGIKMLGGSGPQDFVGKPIATFYLPEDADRTIHEFYPQARQQGVWRGENRVLGLDGQMIEIDQTIFPIRDENQDIIYVATLMVDISARKKAEQTLKFQASLLNQVSDAIIATDTALKITTWNRAAEKIYGWTEAEALGQAVDTLLQTAWEQTSQTKAQKCLGEVGIWHGELQQTTKHGALKTVSASVSLLKNRDGEIVGGVTVNRDITQQKVIEDALRQSESYLRSLVNSQTAFNIRVDMEGNLTYCNGRYLEQFGWFSPTIIGTQALKLILPEDHGKVRKVVAECLTNGGKPVQVEIRKYNREHKFIWTLWEFIAIQDDTGTISEVQCVGFDINKQKLAEQALQEAHNLLEQRVIERTAELESAKQRIEAIFNHSGDGILLLSQTDGIQQANYAFNEMFGLKPHSLIGTQLSTLLHPEDAPLLDLKISNSVAKHQTIQFTARAQRANGTFFDVEIGIAPVNRSHRKVTNLVCIVRDVTERKAAEEALRLSEQRYRLLAENIKDVIVKLSPEGQITFASPSSYHLTQHHPEELIGQSTASLVHPDDLPRTSQILQEAITKKLPFFTYIQRLRHKNGSYVWVEVTNTAVRHSDGSIQEFVGIIHDITDRKMAEAAMLQKQAEERELQTYLKMLHTISLHLTRAETLDDFFQVAVVEGRTNFGFERLGLLLYSPEEQCAIGTYGTNLQGELVDERHFRLTLTEMKGVMRQTLDHSERFAFAENTALYEGITIIGTGQNAVATLWDSQALGWLSVDNAIHHQPLTRAQLDILALYALTVGALLSRKRAELALRENEEKFRLFIESAPVGAMITNQLGEILLVNQELETLSGYERAELIGQNVQQILAKTLAEIGAESGMEASDGVSKPVEMPVKRKDGRRFWADVQINNIQREPDSLVVCMVIDITNRKQAEETLRQALAQEKELSELKSRFVSMASHEFRTPLAAILATTETLAIYRDRMDETQVNLRLEKIRQQVRHMKEVMEDVLHLARMQAGRVQFHPETADLNAICLDIVEEFGSQAEYQDRIVYTCDQTPLTAVFDTHLIRQVVSNLVSNALKYSLKETLVQVNLTQVADQITLTVRDEGIGIPAKDMRFLFEPFHRATNVGTISGTGLGLNITRRAVDLHGGTIVPVSQVNVGTTITVILPQSGEITPEG